MALGVAIGPALADERPAASDQPERTCREWTDGCSVCLRREDGAFGCSLPGIACQPTKVVCQGPMAPRAGANAQGQEGRR